MRIVNRSLCLVLMLFSVLANGEQVLRMSTTTSTENSGLLAVLNPVFEEKYNVSLEVIPVGSGKALKLGENGDVDVIFSHAPKAEEAFMAAGFGVDRSSVMHNDYVIVGAKEDVARVKGSSSVIEALQKISSQQAAFISRGDDSGTHKKEMILWQSAGIKPSGDWYLSAGQGMGAVLTIANEKKAYTISDRGTFIFFQEKIDLGIVLEGDSFLFNPYHIMAVNPGRHPHANYEMAKKYIDFVTSKEGQALIGSYRVKGQQLFYPDVIK